MAASTAEAPVQGAETPTQAQATQATETPETTEVSETKVEESAPAEPPKPTSRQRLKERFSRVNPERTFEGDNADNDLFDATADEFDKFDKERDAFNEEKEKLSKLSKSMKDTFHKFPAVAAGFKEMMLNGTHPADYLIDNYDEDFMDYLNSEEGKATLKKRRADKEAKKAERAKLDEEFDRNYDESMKVLEAFSKKHGMTEEQASLHFKRVRDAMIDVAKGRYTEEILQMFLNAANYEKDVARAHEVGVVEGKNSKIAGQLRQSRRAAERAPSLSGRPLDASEETQTQGNKKVSMFGIPVPTKK